VKKNFIWLTVYSFTAITKESLELEIWNFVRKRMNYVSNTVQKPKT